MKCRPLSRGCRKTSAPSRKVKPCGSGLRPSRVPKLWPRTFQSSSRWLRDFSTQQGETQESRDDELEGQRSPSTRHPHPPRPGTGQGDGGLIGYVDPLAVVLLSHAVVSRAFLRE